jgi:hypothetical protein
MTDALATTDNRTGRRGRDWGLSPTIERARASREPMKPQKPVAAIKPAPAEVVTIATLPAGTVFRIVDDYEGVREAFADRAEELGVALTEIDAAGQMTRGQMQKLLSGSNAKWARQFGFVSLGKALRGTGMKLVFVIDDEKFAPIKAQMQKRRWKQKQKRPHKLLPPPSPPADPAMIRDLTSREGFSTAKTRP